MKISLNKKEKVKSIVEYPFPKEWKLLKLESISKQIYYGITAKAKRNDTGLKMLRTTDINNYKADWANLPFCEVSEKSNNLNRYFLRKDDLIVARAGTVGVSVLINQDLSDTVFGSYLIKVKLKEGISPKFVYYFFQSNNYWKHLHCAQGSTMKNINLPLLKSLILPLPPLPEQNKIAEVLLTVDQYIEEVDKSISKAERLKKGLMQDLLTKGIGHKEYKETEIGKIPSKWRVVRISDIADVKGGKRLPKSHSLVDYKTSYPYIRIIDFRDMYVKIKNLKYLLPETQEVIKQYTISSNDVYISIAGSLGLVGLIPIELNGANLTENAAKLCNLKGVDKKYLVYILNSSLVVKQIYSFTGKAQQPKLALFRIKKIKIPLPTIPEQNKIAEVLSTVDERIQLLKDKRNKLKRVKKGLMNELLTGRKRVKVEV